MEIVLSFLSGALAACILAFVFSFKLKGFIRLFVNLLAGAAALAVLSICGVMPFNAINAFTIGLLGVPGLLAVLIIVTFL
ncbi:MAG: pro-sigmaK processing inhibitor BofA family protein [Clostridiales bacterium]|nr:pro-sigmaK processing inhibitor BofA family protein [Clostridiales bacterium]